MRIVDSCAEREMCAMNISFQHRVIHRYTWGSVAGNMERGNTIDFW